MGAAQTIGIIGMKFREAPIYTTPSYNIWIPAYSPLRQLAAPEDSGPRNDAELFLTLRLRTPIDTAYPCW